VNQSLTSRTVPSIPSELLGPTPRKVHVIGTGARNRIVGLALFAFVAIFSVLTCADVTKQIRHRTALRRDGRVVVGDVTKQRDGDNTIGPYVEYAFSVHGTAFSGWARMPDDLIGTIRQSDRILVRFLPADPAINHPDAWEWSLLFNAKGIYVLISFSILGSIISAILYAERRFVRGGSPTLGTVTSCKPKERLFFLEYDFSKEDGTSIKGSGYSRIPREVGSTIYVLYLPQNPRRSRPYPTPNFRVESR